MKRRVVVVVVGGVGGAEFATKSPDRSLPAEARPLVSRIGTNDRVPRVGIKGRDHGASTSRPASQSVRVGTMGSTVGRYHG